MDDLTKHWNYLSLSEQEGDDISLNKDRCSKEYIIAARFLTRCALNTSVVARTFKQLWRAENSFIVSMRVSIGFYSSLIMKRMLIAYYSVSLGVLISRWWCCRNMTCLLPLVTCHWIRLPSGFKCTTFLLVSEIGLSLRIFVVQ